MEIDEERITVDIRLNYTIFQFNEGLFLLLLRVSSMQDGALVEEKPEVIEENIRNLRRSRDSSKLWLIDNESGFLDAYILMHSNNKTGLKYRWE